uniref:Reverse transcriptase domain-containing protein n=1 Tax=Anolis carolinensis TaxID=28377 RepID=A0A803TYK9_ANOCA
MVSLTIATWNVRGLRMAARQNEILPLLATGLQDIVILQETHLVSEQQRSRVQRLWTKGPSFWSYGEEHQAGVAVLIKARRDLSVDFVLEALPGRLLIVDFTLLELSKDGEKEKRAFRLCGLYAPVVASQRRKFWVHLKGYCSTHRFLLIAGDFNNRSKLADYSTYIEKDCSGKKLNPLTPEERLLESFLSDRSLKDKALEVTNQLNFVPLPCKKAFIEQYGPQGSGKFTWYQKNRASRLDRIRAPAELKSLSCRLTVTPWSDHAMLEVQLALGEVRPRGKPLWRLRPKTIDNMACKEEIASVVANMMTLEDLYASELPEWWERAKRVIRKTCQNYEYVINRKDLQRYQQAVYDFLKCHQNVNQGLPVNEQVLKLSRTVIQNFQLRQKLKRKNYKEFRTKGAVVDVEEWAGAKTPCSSISMEGLRRCEGDLVEADPKSMLKVMEGFYGDLYSKKAIRKDDIESFFNNAPQNLLESMCEGLTQQDREDLVAPVMEEEIWQVIFQGKTKSAPGPDGLGWMFYKTFAKWLVPPLTRVINQLLSRDNLTDSFYQGVLIFFPKQGDLTLPQNWRPIVLTNVDYRIVAKVLNNRLAKLAPKIILGPQTSAVPGRSMLDSLCLFREVFYLAQRGEWKGGILSLDQTKAFDRVHHGFMWEALARKGLPLRFVKFIQLLYSKAQVTPQINGHRGAPIRLNSGVRQGCPLSPLLYVLVLDTVLCQIQAKENITGLRVPSPGGAITPLLADVAVKRVKYAVHADDISFFVNNREEIASVMTTLGGYQQVSGAQINLQKSRLISFVREKGTLCLSPVEVVTASKQTQQENQTLERLEECKILGLWFSIKPSGWEKNWHLWLKKIKEYFDKWKPWRLNVYQKAVYVKTYIMPLALNLAAVYPPPRKS